MRISTMEEVIGNQLETIKNAEPSMKGNWREKEEETGSLER